MPFVLLKPPPTQSDRMAQHTGDDIFNLNSRRLPAITYSKRAKPLPLKGAQFRTRDVYDIPPDSYDEGKYPIIKATTKQVAPPDPDDSPLSEDELQAVYGRNASPIRSVYNSLNVPILSSKISIDILEQRYTGKPTNDGVINKPAPQPASKHRASGNGKNRLRKKPRTIPQKQNNVEELHSARKGKKRPTAPPRRLPVNELVLVASPDGHDSSMEPTATHHGMQLSDPISSSSHQSCLVSPIEEIPDNEMREPITSIRQRLKTPKFTHKSVIDLRRRKNRSKTVKREIGDGFEASELHVDHRLKIKRRRKDTKPLILGFSALRLQAGPLPDVRFEDDDHVLKLERSEDARNIDRDDDHYSVATTEHHAEHRPSSGRPTNRRFGFSDRVLDEMVMKQLSSIFAPRRVYSIPSDASDQDQDDFEETDEEGEESEEEEDDPGQPQTSIAQVSATEAARGGSHYRNRAPTPLSHHTQQNSNFKTRRFSAVTPTPAPTRNEGVRLDFRKRTSHALGQPPTPFCKRNLIEVDDTIYDEPENESRPQPIVDVNDMDEEMLDDGEPTSPAAFELSPRNSLAQDLRPPRSILRNHTPYRQDSDTRPEHTAANTRRNSTRMVEIDLDEESRYFATATDMLQRPQQVQQPRILKHRSSELRRSYPHFNQPREVQILDSDARVLETSQERTDYSNHTNLNVLMRSSDAVWTSSQSLPRAPRDLRMLTRTVSRQHGTMSQSVGRRPSYSTFQSPTKVSRV